ncbi:MAG: serine/threonine protein kinase [Planctomycetota bacterium]|nr:MAG: serine/threonine protein kinase [Planctomycetota bacterium]
MAQTPFEGRIFDSRELNSGGAGGPATPMPGPDATRPLDSNLSPALPTLPPPGHILGGYELLDQIGAGGFSIVMRARHVASGDIVALKLPRVPAFIAHLKREALMAARIQDPQVVAIREVCLDQDPPFLAMPYIAGANLDLPAEAPPPGEIVLAFTCFRQVVDVVARLHAAGITHGDLKPGNIRIDEAGKCHILDLGVARQQVAARQLSTLRASVVSVTGEKIAGTLEFMAPEVMSGAPPEMAADVYALGVILHQLLCGRPPAFGVTPAALNPYLPPGTSDFLRHLLHHDPKRRITDARGLPPVVDGFIFAEKRCLARRNGHARRLVFVERMRTLVRGLRALTVASAMVVLVLLAIRFLGGGPGRHAYQPVYLGIVDVAAIACVPLGFICMLLAMTTINAWYMGIPEKTYKNRRGHPLWTFMMQ